MLHRWHCFILLACWLAASCAWSQSPPNIVYILCDDLGVGDLRSFNDQSKIATPHIDRLAEQGMRFSDAHSGSAVCTPTRYGILCGRYAWRTRLQNGVLGGLSPSLIAADQWTVPKLLRQRNYHSACIGKWHLGLDWQRIEGKTVSENAIETPEQTRSVDYDKPFTGGPLEAGFHQYFGISASLDMVPYVYLKDRNVTASPTVEKSFGMKHAADKNQTRRGPGSEDFTAEDVLPRLTSQAIEYLERRAADAPDQPFFLYVPFASPHTPIAPSPQWRGKSGLNEYADFVMQQDDCVGQIMAALDRLNMTSNTVLFFTSDNGCSPQADLPALREKGHDPCRPYRGHKADIFEGGHRVPLIARWPGVVAPGSHAKQTVCLVDLMATAAEIAQVPMPDSAGVDSFSMLPILRNPQATPLRQSTVHHSINGSFALRRGAYKLCFCEDSGGWSEPKPAGKPKGDGGVQLFDLAADLAETTNIAEKHPDIVARLALEMEQIIAGGRSTKGSTLKNDVDVELWKRARRPADLDKRPSLMLDTPRPWQLFQRRWNVPQRSHAHQVMGPDRGFADVPFVVTPGREQSITSLELRISPRGYESVKVAPPIHLPIKGDGPWRIVARVPAGGWYEAHIRAMDGEQAVGSVRSEAFGVGEIFIVAGQSYAVNANEVPLRVTDPYQRVAAFDAEARTWRVAHDPQPTPGGPGKGGGSIWPAVGDHLAGVLQVPIGLANVAVGGTSSTQWLPESPLHNNLIEAGQQLGDFRAVLWQQGESDVIAQATTAEYVGRMRKIRDGAEAAWSISVPWLLAKSTLHPTVYDQPFAEDRIRSAIDVLTAKHGFAIGPDTDLLADEHRGPVGSMRHFSALGQQRAANMWFASLLTMLQQPRPLHEAVVARLPELHLREPAWRSQVVHRESSVLLQLEPEGPIEARLAYPAEEVLELRAADGSREFQLGRDFVLSPDRLRLVANGKPVIEPITAAQMFPPKDAPNSYRHRAGNPEQYMFYAPGKFFHEHNLEVTYRRSETLPAFARVPTPALAGIRAKLKSKTAVRIGVSGDSITTGLDASGTTGTPPNQPGYVDLMAAQLASENGADITVDNRAVAGWSIAQGVKDLDALLAGKPDLLIVAYGMNDVGRRDPQWFADQAQQLLRRARQEIPELQIIWVAPMLGHREWVHTPRDMFARYRDELKKLVDDRSALADVTQVWTDMLRHKHDLDLTGNGLNHPNDFGHRLYAQCLLELF